MIHRDLRHADDSWQGVVFARPSARRGKPALQVQVADPRLIRLEASGEALLWARVASDYADYEYLISSSAWAIGVAILPPLRFSSVHTIAELPEPERLRAWGHHFAEQLVETGAGPLPRGEHVLLEVPVALGEPSPGLADRSIGPCAYCLGQVPEQPQAAVTDWNWHHNLPPLSLRQPSAANPGRVDAWRKFARAGSVPPLLLWWVSGLDRYVILDGLHRLLACLEEGTVPPALALTALSERRRALPEARQRALQRGLEQALDSGAIGVPAANRLLIEAFDDGPHPAWVTTAYAVPGRGATWRREVAQELRRTHLPETNLLD